MTGISIFLFSLIERGLQFLGYQGYRTLIIDYKDKLSDAMNQNPEQLILSSAPKTGIEVLAIFQYLACAARHCIAYWMKDCTFPLSVSASTGSFWFRGAKLGLITSEMF